VLGQQAANYRFPERHTILKAKKEELLKTYWGIPQRQIETSVVLGMEVG